MSAKIKTVDLKGLRVVLEDKRAFWVRPTHADIAAGWQNLSVFFSRKTTKIPFIQCSWSTKIFKSQSRLNQPKFNSVKIHS
jgi:uncharacterized protein YbdZ (MbtH family)